VISKYSDKFHSYILLSILGPLSGMHRGGATGYARYAPAYPADPACIRVYILYLKKKQKQKNTYL
jgi:hypothetical protein